MMTSIAALMKKSEGLVQFVKFGIVGVSNTGVDWIVFFVLTKTFLHQETVAKAFSFLVAMLNSYLLNTIWTFKKEYDKTVGSDKNKSYAVFAKFALVSIAGWVINTYTFKLVRFNLDQRQIIALIAASAAATFLNFFMNKFWTYKK